jgi:acetyltransferase-like isoleucine patch superfamily enzyme
MTESKIWNGTLGGAPSALTIAGSILYTRIADSIATALWRGNLGALGRKSFIQRGVIIRHPGNVRIDANCSVGTGSSLISENSDGGLLIRANVIIGLDVHLDFTGGLVVGEGTVISRNVTIFTHSHGHDPRSDPVMTPLLIGGSVWIGANATICEGVSVIAPNTIIAAGAVVVKEIHEPGIYGGVPAKLVKKIAEYER